VTYFACIGKQYHNPRGLRRAKDVINLAGNKHDAKANGSVELDPSSSSAVRGERGYAQTGSIDREVKATPGREVRVGIYTSMRADCTAGPLPAIRLSVAPEQGTVSVRRATLKTTNLKQCLAAELPALVAFYRPRSESANDDRFELEVSFADGRKQIQRFRVTIANGANEGQRI
jgi:hypothetical protein